MATLNFAHREITAKVVYYGASDAGCNTNVKRLHRQVTAAEKSQLHKFGPRESSERSYYFDYVVDGTEINGFRLRFRVYSLPGGLTLQAHREEVLDEVDAIVFVADARASQEAANLESLLDLERMLSLQGLELAAVPVILQVNHIDAPSARKPGDVTFDLNPYGFPVVQAAANEGKGVAETHAELVGAVAARIRDNLSGNEAAITLTAVHRATRNTDEDVIRGHLEAIQARTSSTPESVLLEDALPSGTSGRKDSPGGLPPEVRVPFQLREMAGTRPVQLLSGRIVDDGVVLELEMHRPETDEVQRLTVVLENRPILASRSSETGAPPRPLPPPTPTPAPADRVADYLPASIDFPDDEPADLPGIVYGLFGLAGGVIIGLLTGYLLGVII